MSDALMISVFITAHDMASNVLHKLGMEMGTLHGIMMASAAGVGAGLVAIGVAANHYASDFQTQFAKISGLTGSSAQMIDYYKQKILELSPTFDMTATDAAKA